MQPLGRAVEPDSAPRRRRPNHRALAIALLIHVLIGVAILHARLPPLQAPTIERGSTLVMIRLPALEPPPRPAPNPAPKPAPSGVKLAAHPSAAPPAAKTIEHELRTLPKTTIEPEQTLVAAIDPLPNLAAIDVASSGTGTGGAGRAGAGAGAGGKGTGGGLFEECADTPERAMVADVYRMPRNGDSVNAMQGRRPLKRVCLAQLDVTPRNFREGFPGMDGLVEWFGLDIRFNVNIAEAGAWDLLLVSDDGAVFTIDDVQVIDNDGLHQPRAQMARVRLAAGERRFRVRYFQGPREALALQLLWKKAEAKDFEYISRGLLGRPQR